MRRQTPHAIGQRLLALLALLPLGASPLPAQEPPAPVPLQRWISPPAAVPGPGVVRARHTELDLPVLGGPGRGAAAADAGPRLVGLELPDGTALLLERRERRPMAGGGYAWIGRVLGESRGQATLVVRDGKVWGSLRRPGLNLQIRPEPDGSHRMEERDESWWPELADDSVPVWEPAAALDPPPAAAEAGSPTIDVLVVYTAAARAAAGGSADIEALIDLGELETNTSYANSGVGQRIRVVHAEEVAYTEAADVGIDLSRLQAPSDGHLDDVHGLRDTWGADAVSLWTSTGGCGVAYLMTSVSSGFAPWAFSVCNQSCATGNLTFGHELGHNMSLRHDWYVDDAVSPWGFNHGFVDIDTSLAASFRTVMSYGSRCADAFGGYACTRLQYFSNPDVLVAGDAAGVAAGTSQACIIGVEPTTECDADNSQALDGSATVFAAFRPTQVLARLTKEVDLDFVDVGDTITYTLTVTNDSGTTATAVVITDTVPEHTVLDPTSLSLDASASGTAAGSLVTWNTGVDLASGGSLVRTFSVIASEGGIATNTAAVDASNTTLTVASNAVSTSIWESAACGFQDGFESGSLSHFWKVDTTVDGRARVVTDAPRSGAYSAVLDDSVPDSTISTAALVLAADLAGATQAELSFSWAEAGDENGSGDGVFVREAEGDPWVSVLPFPNSPDLVFQDETIDLAAAAAANGLALVDGFQIRFQFEDNWSFLPSSPAGGDGYLIDDVGLSCECALELTSATVSGPTPTVEQSSCTILAGPSYTVDGTGDLTLDSPQGVVLRDGFEVHDGGLLTVQN